MHSCARCNAKILFGEITDYRGKKFCSVKCQMAINPEQQSLPEKSSETVVYCWPYCHAGDGQVKKEDDPVFKVIMLFAMIWIFTMLGCIGFKMAGNCWMFFKYIPFLFLPLLSIGRGLTHIRVNASGMSLESSSGKVVLKSHVIPWQSIDRMYVEMPPKRRSILDGKLVVRNCSGQNRTIPLSKIASAEQWRNLVSGVNGFLDSRLDPCLLDSLSSDATRDPSYTKLWLDALTAPPRRARLQPLAMGTSLHKGEYRVERLLGSGGQGSAYQARSQSNEAIVLKEYILPVYVDRRVRKQALEDFEKEARLLRSFTHEGIVRCLTSFVEDHRAYLVLEYVPGRSLRELVMERGPMSESLCIKYITAMCNILSYLHSQSPPIVHRDFTPDNLLMSPNGSLKLIDFMLAQRENSESSSTVVGKHHYMPPEQFRGQAVSASDLYALGCTAHFLLTGVDPEPMTVSHPIHHNDAISSALDEVVARSTALDMRSRYHSAAELLADLNSKVGSLSSGEADESLQNRLSNSSPRDRYGGVRRC